MWQALIPAGISAAASLIGGRQANIARRREARKQMAFQERMRDTAWQAAVADMRAAGINPALAYGQGPAAAPSGTMAAQSDVITPAVSSALQTKRLTAELKLLDQQTAATAAQAQKTQSEKLFQQNLNRLWGTFGKGREWNPGPLWNKYQAEAATAGSIAQLRKLEIPAMENLAAIASTPTGRWAAWLQYLLRSIRR